MIVIFLFLATPAYPPSGAPPYPQAQQPSAPPTGGPLPTTAPGQKKTTKRKYQIID